MMHSAFDDEQLVQLAFALQGNKGIFALLLGSGISRAAQIPTGWEITLDLVQRLGLAHNAPENTDWEDWYTKAYGQPPNYSDVVRHLGKSAEERRAILHHYIEPSTTEREEGRKTPTSAHHAIATLVAGGYVRVIVTTNFDRLLESALREKGIEPTVVGSADALLGAEPLAHSKCYILKLHGDYKDARILNTEEELSAYPAAYNTLLDRILDEYGLIVAGWSGEWDHALRSAILRAPNRRYPLYWTSIGDVREKAQELISHRRGTVVDLPGKSGEQAS